LLRLTMLPSSLLVEFFLGLYDWLHIPVRKYCVLTVHLLIWH
jgi:hypothetical protein